MPLPYPGFTWSLTQHQHKITPPNLYALAGAAIAAKQTNNPNRTADRLLAKLVSEGAVTLTSNTRDGIARPWRDYQQVLAEIGLMVSTDLARSPTLTQLGMMYFDGTVGFDEVMTTQALRYQYPNGLKTDMQARLAAEFRKSGKAPPTSRIEADVDAGVMIRPGVLVLRLLVELAKRGHEPVMTVDQIGLMANIRTNKEWPQALQIMRAGGARESGVRRNSLDWFKFLGKSVLFDEVASGTRNSALKLSAVALQSLDQVEQLITKLEDPLTFWVPDLRQTLAAVRQDWFQFFGSPVLDEMWSPPSEAISDEYVRQNYVGGAPDEDEEEAADQTQSPALLSVMPFERFVPTANVRLNPVSMANILLGRQRQARGRVLHDQIVKELGTRLVHAGYVVQFDPNSVDLLALRDGRMAIFEIKTVSPRTAVGRIRLGVGQLVEYRRRAQRQYGQAPECVLVLGIPSLPNYLSHWPDVLENGARMGLMGYESGRFISKTNEPIEQEVA